MFLLLLCYNCSLPRTLLMCTLGGIQGGGSLPPDGGFLCWNFGIYNLLGREQVPGKTPHTLKTYSHPPLLIKITIHTQGVKMKAEAEGVYCFCSGPPGNAGKTPSPKGAEPSFLSRHDRASIA